MNPVLKLLARLFSLVIVLTQTATISAEETSKKEARVTQVVRDVKLLPSEEAARQAAINDKVNEKTAVRTGTESRSELTFIDLTITRLGANTVFSFNKAGRNVQLEDGSLLLRVPKDSGGARIVTTAVTAGITGTTVIMETARRGRNKYYVLEGSSRLTLNNHPNETGTIHDGQMYDVPPGATKLPPPINFDINQMMKNHPLLADFPPLPSQPLILQAAHNQPPPNQPVYQGGSGRPPITIGLPGILNPLNWGKTPGGTTVTGTTTGRGGSRTRGSTTTTSSGGKYTPAGASTSKATSLPRGTVSKVQAKPTPTPTAGAVR